MVLHKGTEKDALHPTSDYGMEGCQGRTYIVHGKRILAAEGEQSLSKRPSPCCRAELTASKNSSLVVG